MSRHATTLEPITPLFSMLSGLSRDHEESKPIEPRLVSHTPLPYFFEFFPSRLRTANAPFLPSVPTPKGEPGALLTVWNGGFPSIVQYENRSDGEKKNLVLFRLAQPQTD